ncbi:MAG: OmpA family protein, partial [Myxococcales bacterium]|nr:OmpA family protein [Myxococcales bacterium]
KKKDKDDDGQKWIKKYAPENHMLEAGIYGGVLIPSPNHEFYDPTFAHQRYATVAPDIGLRIGYYPLRFLGVELEGGVMPTSTADGASAVLYAFRPSVIGQLGLWSVTPFVRLGIGGFGASTSSIGNDIDPSLPFGGGVKVYINRWVMLRLDIIDNLSTAVGISNDRAHNVEILLGVSFTLRLKKKKDPIDTDGDGLYDPGQGFEVEDQCPTEPGPRENNGCPLEPGDADGDGILDADDKCPTVPGPAENEGCPWPDRDGDGILDKDDKCPDEPGPEENEGCPWPDRDGDGILDKDDKCPDEPETKNGYQDADGCPDTPPAKLTKFTGTIKGIFFDVDKDTIKKKSHATLNNAVKVLNEFPEQRVEISGHTDSDGSREHNVDLSQRRADAVKKYLVDKGVDAERIETVGHGPDKPIADNNTKKGKAQNRRIEFKLIK